MRVASGVLLKSSAFASGHIVAFKQSGFLVKSFWLSCLFRLAILLAFNLLGCGLKNNAHPDRFVELDQDYRVMAFSRNGDLLALGSGLAENLDHSNVTLLNTNSMRPAWTSVRIPHELTHLVYVSLEYRFLAATWVNPMMFKGNDAASKASLVRVNYDTTFEIVVKDIPGPITSLAVSPDRELVAVCSESQGNEGASCRVYRSSDYHLVCTCSPGFCKALSVGFTNNSRQILLASQVHDDVLKAANRVADNEHRGTWIYLASAIDGTLLHQEHCSTNSSNYKASLVASPSKPEAWVMFDREIRRIALQNEEFHSNTLVPTELLNTLDAYPIRITLSPTTALIPLAGLGDRREGFDASIWFINSATGKVSDTRILRYGVADFCVAPNSRKLFVLHGNDANAGSAISIYDMQSL